MFAPKSARGSNNINGQLLGLCKSLHPALFITEAFPHYYMRGKGVCIGVQTHSRRTPNRGVFLPRFSAFGAEIGPLIGAVDIVDDY